MYIKLTCQSALLKFWDVRLKENSNSLLTFHRFKHGYSYVLLPVAHSAIGLVYSLTFNSQLQAQLHLNNELFVPPFLIINSQIQIHKKKMVQQMIVVSLQMCLSLHDTNVCDYQYFQSLKCFKRGNSNTFDVWSSVHAAGCGVKRSVQGCLGHFVSFSGPFIQVSPSLKYYNYT